MSNQTSEPSGRVDLRPAAETGPRPMLLCAHVVEVHYGASRKAREEGMLEEISTAGALLSMTCPVRNGTELRVDCRTCELRGRVVGCREGPGGYFAEIEFPAEQPWSPAQFRPDHLLNPQSMVCTNPGCAPDCVSQSCLASPRSDL